LCEMIIKKVELVNFRCHRKYELKCEEMTTLILGRNGWGKTSILEAIYEALRGKSFRAVDAEIMRRGADFYRVVVELNDGEKVVVKYDGVKKVFEVGGRSYGRLPKKYKYPIVLFEPDDLNLLNASPTRRRRYFDVMLGQMEEKYAVILAKYNKALKQRNELLKNDTVRSGDMFAWNMMLVRYGTEISEMRQKLMTEINERLTKVYRTIAENDDKVGLRYESKVKDESKYLAELERNFERDLIVGFTSVGVHRDNWLFDFNGVEADGSASRGEVRSIIIALKFIEAELIWGRLGKKPLVLLDDVFSELDKKRQKCLVKNFRDNQVVMTGVG